MNADGAVTAANCGGQTPRHLPKAAIRSYADSMIGSREEGEATTALSVHPGRKRRFSGPRGLAITVLLLAGFGCVVVAGGFAWFANHVSQLKTPADPPQADAIIVLTGGHFRLNAAIDLLRAGKGERLLISGVNPIARDNELREATGLDAALFACCVDIDRAALDTIGNAAESAKWVEQHGFGSIILVTNNYHMPRSLLEMHRLLADVEMSPYPVVNSPIDGGGWMTKPDVVRVLFTEYVKYMTALARSLVTSPTIPPDLAAARARAH